MSESEQGYRGQILIVDDEVEILEALKRQLRRKFDVYLAQGAEQGMAILGQRPIDVILSDQRMPGITGVEFLTEVQKDYPDTVRILLTGYSDSPSMVDAINKAKVFGYIAKPWEVMEIRTLIDQCVEMVQVRLGNRKATAELRQMHQELEARVRERTLELEQSKRVAISLMRDAERMKQRAEENYLRLQASTAELRKLQQAVEQSPVSVIITDPQGVIEYVNPFTCELTQYRQEELLANKVSLLRSGEQSDAVYQSLWQTITSGQVWHGELSNRKSDGSLYWENCTIAPVFAHSGEIAHYVAVKEDITESRAMHKALVAAKEAAELATRAKSHFVANISHEIRTPMNAIIGMSHLALQTQLDHKQRNYIEKVHRSAEGLLGIINDILDFSRIEAGKMTLEAVDFQLEDVMDNLASLLALKSQEKGLELLIDVDADVPVALYGDPLRLGQILINLGNNAVKFTEQGGDILVKAALRKLDSQGVLLHFLVRDTGIGISAEQQARLFQSFSQADSSTTRRFGGSGLGLVICQQLVHLMEGDIWLESEYGQGSTFHFTVRLKQQQRTSPASVHSLPKGLASWKVLVVDDHPSSRKIMATMLGHLGLQVERASSGQEAIDLLLSSDTTAPFDLVLMDWQMPGLNGVETTARMQQDDRLRHKPKVIMVTAFDYATLEQNAKGLNLAGILIKPIMVNGLYDALMQAAGHGKAPANAPPTVQQATVESIKSLRGAKLLLVEDNEINQELALELLVNNGISVQVANNGEEALALLALESFDGVLMDCQMPVMDGYKATREIRKQAQFHALPIIAMTASAMKGVRNEVLAVGMNDYIPKPIKMSEMFTTMAKWIVPARPVDAEEPATQVSPETTAALPPLPGIDTVVGLSMVNDNQAFYRNILIKFRERGYELAQQFQAALSGDMTEARLHVHTLKGLAGSIGALPLQQVAARLEQACEERSLQLPAIQAEMEAELQRVLDGLAAIEAPPEGKVSAVSVSIACNELDPLLRELHSLVTRNNVRADELVQQLGLKLEGTEYQVSLNKIAKAIAGYQFELALEGVVALAGKFGVDL